MGHNFNKIMLLLVLVAQLSGCRSKEIPRLNARVNHSTAEFLKLYRARAELIEPLFVVIGRHTSAEDRLLNRLRGIRDSKALKINYRKSSIHDIKRFEAAQNQLSAHIVQLWIAAEKYPSLRNDREFNRLQLVMRGKELQIRTTRNKLNREIQQFNAAISVPPSSWINSFYYKYSVRRKWLEKG